MKMSLNKDQIPVTLRSLTEDPSSWLGASFLSVSQITAGGLQLLFQRVQEMRSLVRSKGGDDRLKHRLLASVFYEASTRTACSFQSAMMRLGGNYLHVEGHGGNSSAAKKGESLEDTIRCLECYVDVTVLRHPTQGSVEAVIGLAGKPVINAGDGVGEHPTQVRAQPRTATTGSSLSPFLVS
jgi:aspartate carbamoyltransferase catalytic subunit